MYNKHVPLQSYCKTETAVITATAVCIVELRLLHASYLGLLVLVSRCSYSLLLKVVLSSVAVVCAKFRFRFQGRKTEKSHNNNDTSILWKPLDHNSNNQQALVCANLTLPTAVVPRLTLEQSTTLA